MRKYIVFGSNDEGKTLAPIGVFEASDHDAAKKMAYSEDFKDYASVPEGNWTFGEVTSTVILDVKPIQLPIPGQMTVEEVLEAAKADAREAIEAEPEGAPPFAETTPERPDDD